MIAYKKLTTLTASEQAAIPLADTTLQAFITLKTAGDMSFPKRALQPDRKDYFTRRQINPDKIFSVHQEHTQLVIPVSAASHPEELAAIKADGLISPKLDIVLAITVADCLPIYIYDVENGAFGIVHSGWKGTGIVLKAIELMITLYHCFRKNIRIVIGPGIGACCYNVPRERYQQFLNVYGAECVFTKNDQYFLDLQQANINLLTANHIDMITVIDYCTVCTPLFHSYRREGATTFQLMLAYLGYGLSAI